MRAYRARTLQARLALAAKLIEAEVGRRDCPEVIGPWMSLHRRGTVVAQVWYGPPNSRRLISIRVRPTRLAVLRAWLTRPTGEPGSRPEGGVIRPTSGEDSDRSGPANRRGETTPPSGSP